VRAGDAVRRERLGPAHVVGRQLDIAAQPRLPSPATARRPG
jgi:hypothetical protein